jgi:hypothetical protein
VTVFRLFALLGGLATAAVPMLVASKPFDSFVVGVAIAAFFPFAALIALTPLMSRVGPWITLVLLLAIEALATYEFLHSSDGQAGLIFLFMPAWLVVGVFVMLGLDALIRGLARLRHTEVDPS